MSNNHEESTPGSEGMQARPPRHDEGPVPANPIDEVRLGERLEQMVADVSRRLHWVSGKVLEVERAISSIKPATTNEDILSQLLAISRETLLKVSAPNPSATELLEPLLRDVVGLIFDIDQLLQAQENEDLKVFRAAVEKIAERYGISFDSPQVGEPFAPSKANAIRTELVAQKELGGRVTAVLRVGCRLHEKLLFYPQVCVSRYSPEPVSAS